jgi:type IV secretion system protein VirB9
MTIAKTPWLIFNNRVVTNLSPISDRYRSSHLALINLSHNVVAKITCVISMLLLASLFVASPSFASDDDMPITTDNRIKTYIYNPNEVYLLVLHFGYQSHIEFAKGEEIQTISLGDSYAWKITPLANRLFIKPLEKNMRTNMTIITSKRTYQFDIVSEELELGEEKDLVYVIRFYYPKKKAR